MSTPRSFRGRGRRFWVMGAALLAAAAFGVVFVAASGAAPSPCPIPGNFEIDGDMNQNTCAPAANDWDTPGLGVQSTSQGGTYSTAGKDGGDPSTWTSSGSTPNKTDFARAYAFSRVVSGHFFVYVAWERTDTTGTQGYAIEIPNSGSNVAADGTPQPNRSLGGNVFYISSQGAAAPVFNSACSYTSQSDYGSTCTTSNASFTGAINTATITDPLNGNSSQVAGSFFEVALDVTALTGIEPSCPGASAASVYLRSITGQTKNGNLKGYMAPLNVAPDSTCVPPPITTTANPGGSVLPGTSQHDDVTVSDGTNPGVGTVKFFLCSPAQVTANGGDCSANGTQVGLAKTLNGSGQASSDNVTGLTTPNDNAPGKYCWRAEFTPSANDHHYLAGSHTNSTTECFLILATPSISTELSSSSISVGGSVHDSSTLSGATADAGGTVKYRWYSSLAACNAGSYGTTGGTSIGDKSVTNGSVPDSDSAGPFDVAGTYYFRAFYSGDNNNNGAASVCTDETLVVNPLSPSVSTLLSADSPVAIGTTVHDSATLNGATSDAGGTISYALYSDSECSNLVADLTPADNTVTDGVAPDSKGYTFNSAGTFYFQATYSGDSNNTGPVSSPCTSEKLVVKPASIQIVKTADHSAPVNAGDQIGFTVEIKNTGTGAATGVELSDPLPAGSGSGVTWSIESQSPASKFTLSGAAGSQELSLNGQPVTMPAGADWKVHIVATTSQTECSVYDNTATLTTTNANNPAPASASESCAYRVDLSVTKSGSPATQHLGDGNITWTMVVKNNGPDTDTNVQITDPMPAGNTFVSATTTQGTCTGGAILHCNIGTMAAGATVTITLVTTPSAAGTQTNTVMVVGDRPETNTSNNTATATVQVTGPFVPVYCVAVSKITPKQLFVGRKTGLTIHLTKAKRAAAGYRVRIKGPKINITTKRSSAKGIIKQTIKAKRAGILVFTPIVAKPNTHCNTKRVGITGVFTPPVTG